MSKTTTPLAMVLAVAVALLLSTPSSHAQTSSDDETLFERLGGLPAVALVVSDFMDVFVADPLIMANPAVAERKSPDALPLITYQVTTLVCEVTGGPCQYVGPSLHDAHHGLNVTEDEWARMGEIFGATLARHGVGEQETQELFAIIGPTKADIVVAGD